MSLIMIIIGMKISYGKCKGSGQRTDILRKLLKQFIQILKKHQKVFVYVFELKVKAWQPNNKNLTTFFKNLSKRVKNNYKTKLHYFWAREKHNSDFPHYHIVVYLDGHKVDDPYMFQCWIDELWKGKHGWTHFSGYYNLRRVSGERYLIESEKENSKIVYYRPAHITSDLRDVTHHLSYISKSRGKGKRPPQVKDFGHSR